LRFGPVFEGYTILGNRLQLRSFQIWQKNRTGPDFKTLDEAFNEHNFTKREKQLMRNFNIKYECFDARDDFRAQMKVGTIPNEWLTNCTNNICEDEEFNFDDDPFKEPDNQKLCTVTQTIVPMFCTF
jgi:hypothetical protein